MSNSNLARIVAVRRPAVVAYWPQVSTPPHERQVHAQLAGRLAALLGCAHAGEQPMPAGCARPDGDVVADADGGLSAPARCYAVPALTLDDAAQARGLGIRDEFDLFGGVVPRSFMATKIISHDLVEPGARAIEGWSADFARRAAPVALAGFSVFSREDARRAGGLLLRDGPVRLKPARARGGRGQTVVASAFALEAALADMADEDLREDGLVLEENLSGAVTFSVGQLRLPGLTASYSGTQRLTRDNRGVRVYGGSDLNVVAGGFDVLLGGALPAGARDAVERARRYDEAASACFDGFFASRRNYDVVLGRNARGQRKCGVLEQSWRIGGASGAEVAALEILARGAARAVRASVVERYGPLDAPLPAGVSVLFRGDDPEVGPVVKYSIVDKE